jgi:hypothetical protein
MALRTSTSCEVELAIFSIYLEGDILILGSVSGKPDARIAPVTEFVDHMIDNGHAAPSQS